MLIYIHTYTKYMKYIYTYIPAAAAAPPPNECPVPENFATAAVGLPWFMRTMYG
jgi:hypothetical protein